MAAFDVVDFGAGQDKFQQLYDKYNDTVTELKNGSSGKVLMANGIGSDPSYEDYWTAPVIVGSGGAPAFVGDFAAPTVLSETVRYKKSAIANTVSIYGRVRRITTNLVDGAAPTFFFTLPVGFRPTLPNGFIGLLQLSSIPANDFTPISLTVDTAGNVYIINRSGVGMQVDSVLNIDITFTIS